MPPKRKPAPDASAPDVASTSTRPRTRSQKSALEAKPSDLTPVKRARGRPPGVRANGADTNEQEEKSVPATRTERNKVYKNGAKLAPPDEVSEVSEDELNISPSKRRRARASTGRKDEGRAEATPRMLMDFVEITSRPTTSQGTKTAATRGRKKLEEPEKEDPETVHAQAPILRSKKAKVVEGGPVPTTPVKAQKRRTPSPARSPMKRTKLAHTNDSLKLQLPRVLPKELHGCLNAQKRAILAKLRHPPMQYLQSHEDKEEEEPAANEIALQQLDDLLRGTVERGEGNSCLLIGPRGSGKTRLVETAISSQSSKPIIIRLSGHVQTTDRLAMREIARQAAQQTGSSFLTESDLHEPADDDADVQLALPPSSHLPALISILPTLKRPTVVILEAFDLFALHPRQALLYCLLDTAQSCRVGNDMNGIAVIGVTTRVDTINLLEKRVKSRFSGRMLRTASPRTLSDWMAVARSVLTAPVPEGVDNEEWPSLWNTAVEQFLTNRTTENVLNDTFALTRDVSVLSRILMATILGLTPTCPFPTAARLTTAVAEQRCPPRLPFLQSLSYPCMCLLIAAIHIRTSGHDAFTFEMLHELFRDQVRTSTAAPVQVEGGSIGMVKCSREILMAAFEYMTKVKAFVMSGPTAANTAKEFGKYRCMAEREDVRKVVEKLGQTNLKKWFSKAK